MNKNNQYYNFGLEGKVVLITGAATGIGKAVALAFSSAGASVAIGDIDDRAEETARLISSTGGKSLFQKTDVSNSNQVKKLIEKTISELGGLDIAFNNAGVLPPTIKLSEQTEEDWDRVINIDVKGVFLCMKYQLSHMEKNRSGVIINTSSVAGLRADPGMAPYVAAKHAVAGLTKAAAIDYASDGIRVNAIAPGLVKTPMIEGWLNDPEIKSRVLADSPIGRLAEPEDIASLVLFLASDQARIITGAVYPIDGARTSH